MRDQFFGQRAPHDVQIRDPFTGIHEPMSTRQAVAWALVCWFTVGSILGWIAHGWWQS